MNNRLAAVRLVFELSSPSRLRQVVSSFETGGTEYRRVLQECERKKWRAFQTSVVGNKCGDTADKGDKAAKKKGKGKGDRSQCPALTRSIIKHFSILASRVFSKTWTSPCFSTIWPRPVEIKRCEPSPQRHEPKIRPALVVAGRSLTA